MARANILSTAAIAFGYAAILSACSTVQENPNYQYSTKYQGAADTSYAQNGYDQNGVPFASTTPATYQGQAYAGSSSSRSAQQDCHRKESNREIIGGAAGGAIGAVAGNKIIGGTKGTLIGAAVGGTAGFGLGDISVDCSPVAQPVYAAQPTYQQPTYQQPTYQQPTEYQPAVVAAPTDQQYAGQTTSGTPGYEVYQNPNAQVQNPQAPIPSGDTTLTISGPVYAASTPSGGAVEIDNYDYSANLISADSPVSASAAPATQTRVLGANPNANFGSQQSYRVQPGDTVYGLARKQCVSVSEIQQTNNIDQSYGINIGQTISLPQSRC